MKEWCTNRLYEKLSPSKLDYTGNKGDMIVIKINKKNICYNSYSVRK